MKSERCHNRGSERIPWGNFRGKRSCWGSSVRVLSIFCLPRTLQNSHVEALCLWKNLKRMKVLSKKKKKEQKKKKTGPGKKERVPFFQENK